MGRARANGRIVTLWEMVLESGHSDLRQIIDAYGQDADAENRIGFFVERGLLDVEPMQRLVEAGRQPAWERRCTECSSTRPG